MLTQLRDDAAVRLSELQSAIAEINERLQLAADHFTLPTIRIPRPEIDEDAERHALIDFEDNWMTATRALIERKKYGDGNG